MIFYYNSTQLGAPVLSGTAGSLKTLLQTCLVTGFGAGSATGITVASGVATVSFSGAHPYIVDGPIAVAGATPAALNGNKTVTAITANSVQFAAPGVPDGAATGTITTKVPGAGWQEMFAGTANLLALKPSALDATGCFLRVDDSGATSARVVGYETMSDINTGVGPFPTAAQVAGGGHWPKSATASAAAVPWEIFADSRAFHYVSAFRAPVSAAYQGRAGWFFGDFVPRKSGDAWACALLSGSSAADGSGSQTRIVNLGNQLVAARSHTGIGGSARCGRSSPVLASGSTSLESTISGGDAFSGNYPNAPDNALITAPLLVLEGSSTTDAVWRGTIPGVLHSPQRISATAFSPNDVIVATDHLAGRRLMASPFMPNAIALTGQFGMVFYDATGPWR